MKFDKSKQNLIIYPNGGIDSTTAPSVEREILEIIEKNPCFTELILDFSDVEYISSAGLRTILKLKQTYKDLAVIETSLEVYNIFSMTGFTELMEIRKALRKVDISHAEVVGDGFFSTVYRINGDTIVKVFNRTSDPHQIERELKLAKQAFVLGIPTALSFDTVKVGDKLGVCFEMLDCLSLKNYVNAHPDKNKEYLQKYADLLKHINSTECNSDSIPSMKASYQKRVVILKTYLDEEHYLKIKKIIDNIEDRKTLIHGDCHFKNIMVQNGELLLIDMDTLSFGHPIFELAQLYDTYCAFEEDEPGNCERFLGIKAEDAKNLFTSLVNAYFGKNDPELIEKIRIVGYIHLLCWNKINEPEHIKRFNGCKDRLYQLLDKYDDVNF